MISCQLHLDKTDRGISWRCYTHTPGWSPDPLLLLAFLSFPFFRLLRWVTLWPASNSTVVELELIIFRASVSCLPCILAFEISFNFLEHFSHPPSFSRTPFPGSPERGRTGTILSHLANPPGKSPASALTDTSLSQARSASQTIVPTAYTGKVVTGKKKSENGKVARHIPFFLSLSHSCLLHWSFDCFLACLLLLRNGYRAVGPGPHCGHQQGFHSRSVSQDPFTIALAAEPAQAVCFPSLCLLSLAGINLFPVPSFSGIPVNTS